MDQVPVLPPPVVSVPVAATPFPAVPLAVAMKVIALPDGEAVALALALFTPSVPLIAAARFCTVAAVVAPICTCPAPAGAPDWNVYVVEPILTVLPAVTFAVRVRVSEAGVRSVPVDM